MRRVRRRVQEKAGTQEGWGTGEQGQLGEGRRAGQS